MDKNDNYLKEERQGQIKVLVEEQGKITIPELSRYFNVSEATIRRDLESLSKEGKIRRMHGYALRLEKTNQEPPIIHRLKKNTAEKERIAKAAVQFINNGETIFLGSGTTVIEVARNIPADISLTVITNSLPVVNELADHQGIELIVIGGMLRHSELSMVGHVAEQAVLEFRADKAIVGMYAIDVNSGFTNDYLPEIMTDRAILNIARQVIVVADHSKFGRVSSMLVSPVTAAQMIITDQAIPAEIVEQFRELGINLILT